MASARLQVELRRELLAQFLDLLSRGATATITDGWSRHVAPELKCSVHDFAGSARYLAEQLRRHAADEAEPTNPDVAAEFFLALRVLAIRIGDALTAVGAHIPFEHRPK